MNGPGCALELFTGKFSLSFFFFSLWLSQFGLLSHISSLRLSSGHSGLFLILSMQPMPPCSAPTHCWQTRASGLATSLLGVVVRCVNCGFFFFFPPGYVALWDSKTPHRPANERVSWCLETSPPSRLPPQDGSPSLTLFSLFVFYILSYLLLKRMGCLSGCLVSSTSIQQLFRGICSAFKWFFNEFVGEKVISTSYSFTIFSF